MDGHEGLWLIQDPEDGKETAMKSQNREVSVSAMGLDVHDKFSTVTMRGIGDEGWQARFSAHGKAPDEP